MGTLSWYNAANCRNNDPTLFFEVSVQGKQICEGCPVGTLCLLWALYIEENDISLRNGVWGGKTRAERHRLANDLQITQEKAKKLYERELVRLGLKQ